MYLYFFSTIIGTYHLLSIDDTSHPEEGAMKSAFGSKGDRKDNLIAEDLTRREFLKAGIGSAAVICDLEMFAGSATTEESRYLYQ